MVLFPENEETNSSHESLIYLVISALGFGMILLLLDDVDLPAVVQHPTGSYALPLLLVLAGTVFLIAKMGFPHHIPPVVIGILSALCALRIILVCFTSYATISDTVLLKTIEVFFEIVRITLFILWAALILRFGARKATSVFALGLFTFAVINILTLILKAPFSDVFVVLLPLISGYCYFTVQKFLNSDKSEIALEKFEADDNIYIHVQSVLTVKNNYFLFVLGMALPTLCSAIIFCSVYTDLHTGVLAQVVVEEAQLGVACGALIAGIGLFVLARWFWSFSNTLTINITLPALALFLLWIAHTTLGSCFIIELTMTASQKLLLWFVIVTPYSLRLNTRKSLPFLILYVCYLGGRSLGQFFDLSSASILSDALFTFVIVISLMSTVTTSLFFQNKISKSYGRALERRRSNTGYYTQAIQLIAKNAGLTQRETEMLAEFGRGRNSAYVAERLVISPLTTKTHQKNIYAKLDLHSQQDLIVLVDRTIEQLANSSEELPGVSGDGSN